MQRPLIIAAITLVILGLGAGAFFLFSGSSTVTVAPTGATFPVAGQGSGGFGGGGSQAGTSPGTGGGTNTPVTVSARLVQISTGPIVPGEVVIDGKAQNASSSPQVTVQYIARESGNVFSYLSGSGTLTRINNKTIPGIQSASWFPNGSFALVRYLSGSTLSTINTYALASTSATGFFLPQNLSDVTASAAGILNVASGVTGSIVSLSRADGSHNTTLFTTALTAIRVSFAGKNQYLVFSKPSVALSGDAFLTDANGRLSRIAGPLNGLVALASPTGKWVLVSYTSDIGMQMELVNTATDTMTPLPIATIADKCVWTADESALYCGVPVNPDASAAYPDDWYQGATHFSDRIWKINVASRFAQMVLDFSQTGEGGLDATALAIDPAGTLLTFVNKNDGSLWGYSL